MTTKRFVGNKRFTYSTTYLRQLAKAIHCHYFDKDIGQCNVNVEMDGISLTVGSTRYKTFRSPPIVAYKYKETIKIIDEVIVIFKKRNAKRKVIEETLAPMWKEQIRKGGRIQH